MGWLVVAAVAASVLGAGGGISAETFDGEPAVRLEAMDGQARVVEREGGGRAVEAALGLGVYPNVSLAPPEGAWDWSGYAGLTLEVYNPKERPVPVIVRLENPNAEVYIGATNQPVLLAPKRWTTVSLRWEEPPVAFWGMRGVPGRGAVPVGWGFDASRVAMLRVVVERPEEPLTLGVDNLRLLKAEDFPKDETPLPIVDEFGQYVHGDWPGKVHGEEELLGAGREEDAALKERCHLPGRCALGGWTDGPMREGTGWFRTERLNGKWWLVDPHGHLFFSLGMNTVTTSERTWVTGRDRLFAWLPDRDKDALFSGIFREQKGAHSRAEAIGGGGWTFSWYCANLARKYGPDWQGPWREKASRRLVSWGFNTLGNWTDGEVVARSGMPYVAGVSSGAAREFGAGQGYWGRMKDVFDPSFPEATRKSIACGVGDHAKNPLCLGYFCDNELSWEDVAGSTLDCPPEQPCRRVFIERLQARYGTVEAVNKAWGTGAADWDLLRTPKLPNRPTEACLADIDGFEYAFARRYFDAVAAALREHAPNHLYLGCRFARVPDPALVRACAEAADVVSFNLYQPELVPAGWTGPRAINKPVMIGEFHCGATDRGLFHPGLVETANQRDRAAMYKRYVRSVADLPEFVGCHWFQYIDQPLTGRSLDGESFNIGFVTVADTAYPEMVDAAREVHAELYARRYGQMPAQE